MILDGFAWGDPDNPCNAVALAGTPVLDRLRRTGPSTELRNNGPAVGLPEGQMGNSEVGHLNIGAGRVVPQDFVRINQAVRDGVLGDNDAYRAAFRHVREHGGRLHLMGLLGPGGIHAHQDHVGAALKAAADHGIQDVYVHPVTDGRDTPPRSAAAYLETLRGQIEAAGVGRVADLVGRYYAMDRDRRWDRTEKAFRLYTRAEGHAAESPHAALEAAYGRGEGDEFVAPTTVDPDGVVRDGDAVVWMNFRPDRSRQITRAFMQPDFDAFRAGRPEVRWVCTTRYDQEFPAWPRVEVAFPPLSVPMTLAEHVSRLGLTQFHTAETEKYAHVTYFLNGGREDPWPGEDRALVPSPKVATYDLKPEMSAGEVTDGLLHAMGSGGYDLVVVNYANPDMVGHTGDLQATIEALAFVDHCLDRAVSVATELGFVTLVTADHGNAEDMCRLKDDGTPGEPVTKHSMNPSPLLVVNAGNGVRLREGGALCNVAPTLLDLMGLPIPDEMGASLVERAEARAPEASS